MLTPQDQCFHLTGSMKTVDHQRFIFRQIRQDQNEPFDSFFRRLREQEKNCNFIDSDCRMKEQIIAECSIRGLRREAFKDDINLDQLIFMARTLESEQKAEKRKLQSSSSNRQDCTRCGSESHKYFDAKCPALKSKCAHCKKFGHFSEFCRDARLDRKRLRSSSAETVKIHIDKKFAEERLDAYENMAASDNNFTPRTLDVTKTDAPNDANCSPAIHQMLSNHAGIAKTINVAFSDIAV